MNSFINILIKYKPLLFELVKRDVKTKYRRSILGYLWSLLNPLLMMVVVTIVFSYMFRFDIPNYPIYLLAGQIIFNFFSESTNFALTSIIQSNGLISKVYIPKYIFPISKIMSSFVNLIFSLMAIVIMLIMTKTKITFAIILFPLPLIYVFLFSIGIGLIVSIMAVYFRDMLHLYGVILTIWMYLTPIFYPASILPDNARFLMKFNPLFHFISVFREIVLYGNFPTLRSNLVCLGFVAISIFAGVLFFRKYQDNIIIRL